MNGIESIEKRKAEIGNRIRYERKEVLGLSQDALAEKLNRQRDIISKWENGYSLPDLTDLLKMCELFNCEVGYLLCEEGYENKTRTATDICKSTGLSEEAVNLLIEEKETYDELMLEEKEAYDEVMFDEPHVPSNYDNIILEIVERIIKNDNHIQYEILSLGNTKRKIKSIETDVNYKLIESAFSAAMKEGISIKNSDMGVFDDAKRKQIFLDRLKDLLIEDGKEHKRYLIESITSGKNNGFFDAEVYNDLIKRTNSTDFEIGVDYFIEHYSYGYYEALVKRSSIEKDELAIGLKFQKIMNEVLENYL